MTLKQLYLDKSYIHEIHPIEVKQLPQKNTFFSDWHQMAPDNKRQLLTPLTLHPDYDCGKTISLILVKAYVNLNITYGAIVTVYENLHGALENSNSAFLDA